MSLSPPENPVTYRFSHIRVLLLIPLTPKSGFLLEEWTAWFTTELPISDGPYKFHGLPGLILKIYDKTNTYSFDIISRKTKV